MYLRIILYEAYDFGKCLSELPELFRMNEDTLPFLPVRRFAGRDFRNRYIGLILTVSPCVDVIDAGSGADAPGDYWFIHFDDVFRWCSGR